MQTWLILAEMRLLPNEAATMYESWCYLIPSFFLHKREGEDFQ